MPKKGESWPASVAEPEKQKNFEKIMKESKKHDIMGEMDNCNIDNRECGGLIITYREHILRKISKK